MSTANTSAAKPKRRWLQFRLRTMLLGVAVFAFCLGMVIHFWPHVRWRSRWRMMHLHEVQSVPTAPMPPADTPDDWVGCRFGPLEFDLPRSVAEGFETREDSRAVLLQDSSRRLVFTLPGSADKFLGFLRTNTAQLPELHTLSPARFRLATYEASSDDYRWTMSRKELAEHAWLVSLRAAGGLETHERVEILFRDDIEGLLSVYPKVAQFEWFSTDGRAWGVLTFFQESADTDLTWVRAVCRSLRFSGEVYPDEVTGEELAALFEIVEPEP